MNPQSPASHRAGILAIAPGNTETLFPFPQDEIEVITIVPCFAVSAPDSLFQGQEITSIKNAYIHGDFSYIHDSVCFILFC